MERCSKVINQTLLSLLEGDPRVYILGEDILDPYGGTFKVTKGLSTQFPERVLTTPISEAAITGIAAGMAIRGLRPIVEIMFGDFLTLALDQIVNYAAKFSMMYNGQVSCPMVIRTPMGGGRGYGPTHSQSLEKILLGVPGIAVVSPSCHHDIQNILTHAVTMDQRPVIFIEDKGMYGRYNHLPENGRLNNFSVRQSDNRYPTLYFSLNHFKQNDLTLFTYGGMTSLALDAALDLAIEDEIFVEVISVSQLNPVPVSNILAKQESKHVILLEPGTLTGGWGAEVIATLNENPGSLIKTSRLAVPNSILPASKDLENWVIPNKSHIIDAVHKLLS